MAGYLILNRMNITCTLIIPGFNVIIIRLVKENIKSILKSLMSPRNLRSVLDGSLDNIYIYIYMNIHIHALPVQSVYTVPQNTKYTS